MQNSPLLAHPLSASRSHWPDSRAPCGQGLLYLSCYISQLSFSNSIHLPVLQYSQPHVTYATISIALLAPLARLVLGDLSLSTKQFKVVRGRDRQGGTHELTSIAGSGQIVVVQSLSKSKHPNTNPPARKKSAAMYKIPVSIAMAENVAHRSHLS